jgi:hypothetical protein
MPSRGVLVDQASHTSPRTSLSLLRVRSDRSLSQPRLSSELKKGECCDVRTAAGEHVRQVPRRRHNTDSPLAVSAAALRFSE